MKNIQQIHLISKALINEKEKHLHELSKLNKTIEKKSVNIQKILAYHAEYHANDTLKISKSLPFLYKNLNEFSKKIQHIIKQEEQEIHKLKQNKSSIEIKVKDVNHKLKIMTHFQDRHTSEKRILTEKQEQSHLDELSSTKFSRSRNE